MRTDSENKTVTCELHPGCLQLHGESAQQLVDRIEATGLMQPLVLLLNRLLEDPVLCRALEEAAHFDAAHAHRLH